MPSRVWKILPAVSVIALSTGVYGQNYQELSATVTGPWHHVPDARSTLEFNRGNGEMSGGFRSDTCK
jgi:hypothetical protein